MSNNSVLIVGGGIIGACTAWYLTQAGKSVTIIERDTFGKGCSHGNCGLLSPSHVTPLPRPGMVSQGLSYMLKSNAPFYIRPTLSPSRIAWLMKFAAKCNKTDMMNGSAGRQALLDSSFSLFHELFGDQNINCDLDTIGALFVFKTQECLDRFSAEKAVMDQFDRGGDFLDGMELVKREPALKVGLAGAWHFTCDNHLRPSMLMSELKRILLAAGVTIVENCNATEFIKEAGQLKSIRTSKGDMTADEFVISTGAWSPMLNKAMGVKIPIQPGKGYSITMNRPDNCPRHHCLFQEAKVVATPWKSGYRLGSTMEFSGYDTSLNEKRLNALKVGAQQYLNEPAGRSIEEEWYGFRPMTTDGMPIIDRLPNLKNVIIAAGHNMLGISMGTGTGKLITELMCGTAPHIDPTPYRLSRF